MYSFTWSIYSGGYHASLSTKTSHLFLASLAPLILAWPMLCPPITIIPSSFSHSIIGFGVLSRLNGIITDTAGYVGLWTFLKTSALSSSGFMLSPVIFYLVISDLIFLLHFVAIFLFNLFSL